MVSVLELIFAADAAPEPPVVALQLAGATEQPLSACLPRRATARRRLFPAPGPGAAPSDVRSWYRDLWWALSGAERNSLVGAAGPGSACLALLSERGACVLATVREPRVAVAAAVAAGARLPNRAALLALRDDPERTTKPRLRAVANAQSRELLVPWVEADDLPVTVGPPPDAHRWRQLLFEQALPTLQPVQIEGVTSAPAEELPRGHAYTTLLLELNWLDRELHDCYATSQG